jgi:hypothetical protein
MYMYDFWLFCTISASAKMQEGRKETRNVWIIESVIVGGSGKVKGSRIINKLIRVPINHLTYTYFMFAVNE